SELEAGRACYRHLAGEIGAGCFYYLLFQAVIDVCLFRRPLTPSFKLFSRTRRHHTEQIISRDGT
ncbi:hypothetical protein KYX90_13855, partial [Enterococcus lactis]|nr:hypothetical protein [Enterococcus lactis]